MSWLNYHHLLYFWTVARAGTIAKAGEELHLAQPTISSQIKLLEESLGHKLFERQGRKLVLTDVGRTVMRYADEIFRLGNELKNVVGGLPSGQQLRLHVGVADVVPKVVAERLLQPALDVGPLRIICREGPLPQLLASLALHELDVVLADAPRLRARQRPRPSTTCSASAACPSSPPPRIAHLKKDFPRSLDGAPMLMPSEASSVRHALDLWFDGQRRTPHHRRRLRRQRPPQGLRPARARRLRHALRHRGRGRPPVRRHRHRPHRRDRERASTPSPSSAACATPPSSPSPRPPARTSSSSYPLGPSSTGAVIGLPGPGGSAAHGLDGLLSRVVDGHLVVRALGLGRPAGSGKSSQRDSDEHGATHKSSYGPPRTLGSPLPHGNARGAHPFGSGCGTRPIRPPPRAPRAGLALQPA